MYKHLINDNLNRVRFTGEEGGTAASNSLGFSEMSGVSGNESVVVIRRKGILSSEDLFN